MNVFFQSIFPYFSFNQRQKRLALKVNKLEKLINRAIGIAENAVSVYDESRRVRYKRTEEHEFVERITTIDINLRAMEHVKQNQELLFEIKAIFDTEGLKVPITLRNCLRDIQNKNNHIETTNVVNARLLDHLLHSDDGAFALAYEASLSRGVRVDLADIVTSLRDFQDLFHQYYSFDRFNYVHEERLNQLQRIKNDDFDLSKLILLCKELNSAYQNQNYLSVTMLVRSILDHIPPIFGFDTFVQVESNYSGGKSMKKSFQNLQNSSRNIADAYLHLPIRKKESLPNEIQVDFRNDLDALLAEIIRILS